MTVAPLITDDAAGITTSPERKGRLGSVVDALLGPTPGGTDGRIVDIPLNLIEPHPRNRKIDDADVQDIVADIKTGVGLLQPINVSTGAAYNAGRLEGDKEVDERHYVITGGGHRRHRACELAGETTVPCIIRDDLADAKGRRSSLLENLHRQDLDPFEEAEAFSELVERYKISQRDLAGDVGCKQPHISKRLQLLKLPSKYRAAWRLDKLSIGDLVEFARAADDPDVLEAAYTRYQQQSWLGAKRAVEQATRERDDNAKHDAAVAALKDAGGKVHLGHVSWHPSAGYAVKLSGLDFTATKHKNQPCHATHVAPDGETVQVCTDYKRHGPKGKSELKSKRLESSGNAQTDEQKAARRRQKLLKEEITPARWAWLRDRLTTPGGIAAGDAEQLYTRGTVALALAAHGCGHRAFILHILDLHPPEEVFDSYVIRQLAETTTDPHQLRVIVAVSYFETELTGNGPTWYDDERWYLELLERNGYVISDVEHEQFGDTLVDGVWQLNRQPRRFGARTCEACFAYETSPGVTLLETGLCAACQDAQDAGWLTPQPEAVAG